MKKIYTLFFYFVLNTVFGQTTIRVTNGQNLQTVMDGAADNSVIIVEGGNYGNIVFNRPLKLYGTGYYLNGATANSGFQATPAVSNIANVTFLNNSTGSSISGFNAGNLAISANQIIVSRCRFGSLTINNSNFQVKQSFFGAFTIAQNLLGVLINNNLIEGNGSVGNGSNITFLSNTYYGGVFPDVNGNIGVYKNNIFTPRFPLCIDYVGYFNNFYLNMNNIISYNIFGIQTNKVCSFYGTDQPIINLSSTNKVGQDYTNMLITSTTEMTLDARYQLASNSPAKGAGENGTDCGAFGGDDPYVLSGIPSIPSIYQLTVPAQVPQNGTLNIQIKAKTNN